MEASEKQYLAERLKEAGMSGEKAHVISSRGRWVIVREGLKKAIGSFKQESEAAEKAKSLLDNGITQIVIFHNRDGSVARILHSKNAEVHYSTAG